MAHHSQSLTSYGLPIPDIDGLVTWPTLERPVWIPLAYDREKMDDSKPSKIKIINQTTIFSDFHRIFQFLFKMKCIKKELTTSSLKYLLKAASPD